MKQKLLYLFLVFAVVAAGWYWYRVFVGPRASAPGTLSNVSTTTVSTGEEFNFPYQSALDGSGVMDRSNVYPSVVGVMIDNHPDARPERGLSKARVVYEAPVESPYTRYLALFAASDSVSAVGPVRSARPYFIDWAGEYKALYLHSGGSPDALAALASSTAVHDVNEFYNGGYFWRDTVRVAPHNLFTKDDLWISWLNDNQVSSAPTWPAWRFVTSSAAIGSASETAVQVHFSYAPDYSVGWIYKPDSFHYERQENGATYHDEDGGTINAGTVVVQMAAVKTIDSAGRRQIGTTGQGDARVFAAGRMFKGTWIKQPNGRTRFYDALGNQIPFMPGPVWVEVAPVGTSLTTTN